MSRPASLATLTSQQLSAASKTVAAVPAVVGLDGFVDTILHVVKQRESVVKFTRQPEMREFAKAIDSSAGLSANFEFVTKMVKLGGNGPIMANALGRLGLDVTYVGNLGAPNLHPVFSEFASRAKVVSIAEPGYTDAIEFDNGKLMCGKHESLKDVNWANLIKHVPEPKLIKLLQGSKFVAMVNWTMLTQMTGILKKLLTQIAPKLRGERRWIFFDLCDPAKRSREDLLEAVKLIAKFEKHFRVILGLNLSEGRQVAEVLGFPSPDETYGTVTHCASQIREALKIDTVVVHPTHFASAADGSGSTHVVGPFTAEPKITTGAGDHFNAGFCLGRLAGFDLASSLQVGVATSGYYVRNAKSPSIPDLVKFLKTLE
ncbi:MAG TPA: PfkB family carbohydrate kinase [Chthoniobacteraceae bacterium]|nr:PfkB family carbohydrate kinase [Chthoniobacteraceae bacterium]